MDALAADTWQILPPLLVVVGLVGVVVPVLPGTLLVLAGVLVWALTEQSTTGWVVLSLSVLVAAVARVLQYLVPGRRMKQQGVRTSTLAVAVLLAVVGFFVIPVIGAAVGFLLGIWLVEVGRGTPRAQAWTRTKHAAVGVLQSVGIELAGALSVAGLYVVGLLVS
ncbi:DUF456 domain-containing protein [Phycicoccus avicenniae]|uniref:DUF456 domain-containing protein n=1 Tax=Phycicoccus avicenniae TaxID=2828860 RepID=UPI003D2E78C8